MSPNGRNGNGTPLLSRGNERSSIRVEGTGPLRVAGLFAGIGGIERGLRERAGAGGHGVSSAARKSATGPVW